MLSLLQIENIATIEKAAVQFGPGLNILTGETGAGKSILIDAVLAVSGAKTSRELLRTGAASAYVSALFTDVGGEVLASLDSLGLPAEDDGSLLLQRRLMRDGKNVCFVNGASVTLSMLRALAAGLVNVHGQRDSGALLDEDRHVDFLDAYALDGPEREAAAAAYARLTAIRAQKKALVMDESEKARRLDLLRYQIDELKNAGLTPGETQDLRRRRNILNNSMKVVSALSRAVEALIGGGEAPGADALLASAAGEIESVTDVAKELSPIGESVEGARETVLEAASVLDDALRQLSENDDDLDEIEARLDLLYRLSRKYGETEEEMLKFLSNAEEELDSIVFAEERLEKLALEEEKAAAETDEAEKKLTEKRVAAARKLTKAVEEELSFLDMPGAVFPVEVAPCQVSENGADRVTFLFSANPGEEPKPLDKVASGGELSRVMLSLKNVLGANAGAGTLVFDEIDSGVSGSASGKIALKLSSLAKSAQVFCVTHSAQLAAFADEHIFLSKEVRGGKTYTAVTPLSGDERAKELARITYGAGFTETQVSSMREMISRAAKEKQ
ncbi:MAG: DNA repair protein RecN [Clostridia bacterium]|nr:DNA repair protein RecN [Clostridia bacterium]